MLVLEAASLRDSDSHLSPASIILPRPSVMSLRQSDFRPLSCRALFAPEEILSSVTREVRETSRSTGGHVQCPSISSAKSSGVPDDAAFAPDPERPPQLE